MLAKRFYRYAMFTTVWIFIFVCLSSHAQLQFKYHPRQTHSEFSKDLIHALEFQFSVEDKNMPSDREVRRINFERRMSFMEKVFEGAFIKDDSLETYVGNVLNNLVEHNKLQPHPRRVLVLSSPYVNAVCYGQGIYAVTISLLSRIENENQLAFILAHELAHDELGHIRTRIIQEADLDLKEKARKQTFKIISGKIDNKEIENFRNLIYDYCRHSRMNEMRADSMALTLLRHSNYNEQEIFPAMTILQSTQSPKHKIGAELFSPFHTADQPFQDYWLNNRLTVYSKNYMGTFLYSADSIETHPTIAARKNALRPYLGVEVEKASGQPLEFVNAVSEMAAFETVESSFKNRQYDLSLYYALQLYNRYPENSYLVSRIGKILTDLYEFKGLPKFENYVAKYTLDYGNELKLINNFLYNVSQPELGKIAFHFLNNASNFNPAEKNHYYLLWKISSLTYRDDLTIKTSGEYRSRFGGGIQSHKFQ
ncbi:MAG TPA: M48 family metalloprotease [Chryseolinea sp.]|nr:M48 family metalloprotease [Chryseolinea sp.]